MKYLKPLEHDDHETVKAIAQNTRLNSYPALNDFLGAIEGQYKHYVSVEGNTCRLTSPLSLPDALSKALRTHYETKPGNLKIIKRIRHELSPDVCPMCGSLSSPQVDHVAPKDIYPEYSFFTRNLVPACNCNGLKGIAYKGEHEGQRILHPYYDTVMQQRLAWIKFSGDFDSPIVEIVVDERYEADPAVNYHIDKILRKTNVITWASKKWATIRRSPESVFPVAQSRKYPLTVNDTEQIVLETAAYKYDELGTLNNWYSMVFYGLVHSEGAIEYVTQRINGLRYGTLNPD